MDTTPRYGDSDVILLHRIVAKLSADNGGAFAPRFSDGKNTLLWKWAKLLAEFGL